MGQAVPSKHNAVVLRSHFNQLRALLVVALIAVIGLTVTVVILAGQEDQAGGTSGAEPVSHINYGGYNPATGRPGAAPLEEREHPVQSNPVTGSRYDGAADDTAPESPNGPGARTD